MKAIIKKLFVAKKEIGKISKDSTNPFFKSKYFDINQLLEHVEPILEKNGLVILQPILDNHVVTEIHDIESGELVQSRMLLPNISEPQKLGSAITYYRRYTLQSLLSLQAEDDDGNKASKKSSPKQKPKSKPTITDAQFDKASNSTDPIKIQAMIDGCNMSGTQKKDLTQLIVDIEINDIPNK